MSIVTDWLWKVKALVDRLEAWLLPPVHTCLVCGDEIDGIWINRKHCEHCFPTYLRMPRPRPLGKASSR